jgi:hypothetical protein
MLGVAAFAAVGLLGVGLGASSDDHGGGVTPVHVGRLTELEQSGTMRQMLRQHQDMLSQMQATMTPQMLQMMRNDPMWQMLQSGEIIRLQEEHEGDIDRMLAR